MWRAIKENLGKIFGYILLLLFLTMLPIACVQDMKAKDHCLKTQPNTTEFQLVSLFDYQNVSKKSSLSGGFFLMMGAVSGTSTEDLKYYIRYAYEDQYGIKLMTEKIDNRSKIRIKEVKDSSPMMIVKYEKVYSNTVGCIDFEMMRIFEIPEGTVYKTFEMDMK